MSSAGFTVLCDTLRNNDRKIRHRLIYTSIMQTADVCMCMQKEEKVVKVTNTCGRNSAAKILWKWLNTTANLTMENITPLPTQLLNQTLLQTSLQTTEH